MVHTASLNMGRRGTKRLPSWGDPILSHCSPEFNSKWKTDEDNFARKFNGRNSWDELTPLPLSDPMQESDMQCFFQNASETQDACGRNDWDTLHEETSHDDTSLTISEYYHKSAPFEKESDWSIETCNNGGSIVSFRLRYKAGAYLMLLEDEILESVQSILVESTENLIFLVYLFSGQAIQVESDGVLDLIESILYRQRVCLVASKELICESESCDEAAQNLPGYGCFNYASMPPRKRQKKSIAALSPYRKPSNSKIGHWPVVGVE